LPTPEELARQTIDRLLEASGWQVQDYKALNLASARGIAVREFPLTTGEVDYLLYADAKVIGTVEAKPEGHTLRGVETQSAKYAKGLPEHYPRWSADGAPLLFAYESTGAVTHLTSSLDPDPCSREVFSFHRPEELIRLAELPEQLRGKLQHMPPLETGSLWEKQITRSKTSRPR
jgi:type I restriction enzyme R subunit